MIFFIKLKTHINFALENNLSFINNILIQTIMQQVNKSTSQQVNKSTSQQVNKSTSLSA
jgi:hypothetical protein